MPPNNTFGLPKMVVRIQWVSVSTVLSVRNFSTNKKKALCVSKGITSMGPLSVPLWILAAI